MTYALLVQRSGRLESRTLRGDGPTRESPRSIRGEAHYFCPMGPKRGLSFGDGARAITKMPHGALSGGVWRRRYSATGKTLERAFLDWTKPHPSGKGAAGEGLGRIRQKREVSDSTGAPDASAFVGASCGFDSCILHPFGRAEDVAVNSMDSQGDALDRMSDVGLSSARNAAGCRQDAGVKTRSPRTTREGAAAANLKEG